MNTFGITDLIVRLSNSVLASTFTERCSMPRIHQGLRHNLMATSILHVHPEHAYTRCYSDTVLCA